MTALLYARVSTEDQAEKYGLSSQVRALHVLAAVHERRPRCITFSHFAGQKA